MTAKLLVAPSPLWLLCGKTFAIDLFGCLHHPMQSETLLRRLTSARTDLMTPDLVLKESHHGPSQSFDPSNGRKQTGFPVFDDLSSAFSLSCNHGCAASYCFNNRQTK